MVSVPVRASPVIFGWTWKTTVPLPVPEIALVILIQVSLLVAVHEQLVEDACIAAVPVPPALSND
jgi:hypothetical protein